MANSTKNIDFCCLFWLFFIFVHIYRIFNEKLLTKKNIFAIIKAY